MQIQSLRARGLRARGLQQYCRSNVSAKVGFAAFYESLGRVDLTDRHPDEKPVTVSGTRVREQLKAGEGPDPRIMRPEVADILIEAYGH